MGWQLHCVLSYWFHLPVLAKWVRFYDISLSPPPHLLLRRVTSSLTRWFSHPHFTWSAIFPHFTLKMEVISFIQTLTSVHLPVSLSVSEMRISFIDSRKKHDRIIERLLFCMFGTTGSNSRQVNSINSWWFGVPPRLFISMCGKWMSMVRLFVHRAGLLPVTVGLHYLFPPANLVVSLVSLQLVIVECHCCVIISRSSGNSFINK